MDDISVDRTLSIDSIVRSTSLDEDRSIDAKCKPCLGKKFVNGSFHCCLYNALSIRTIVSGRSIRASSSGGGADEVTRPRIICFKGGMITDVDGNCLWIVRDAMMKMEAGEDEASCTRRMGTWFCSGLSYL